MRTLLYCDFSRYALPIWFNKVLGLALKVFTTAKPYFVGKIGDSNSF